MGKSGGIIAVIAGVLGLFAAAVTLMVWGLGSVFNAESAGTVIGLGWGGIFFCFLTIIFGAVAINAKSRTPGILIIISSILGVFLGGNLVAILMVLALAGGILATVGAPAIASSTTSEARHSKGDYLVGIVVTAILLFSGAAYLTKDNTNQADSSPKSKNDTTLITDPIAETDPLEKLNVAQPSELFPYGELEEMFSYGNDFTNLQREIKLKEIQGKVVAWRLPVYDVQRSGDGYRIQTNATYKNNQPETRLIGTFVNLTARNVEDRRLIESLKTGDIVSFKGIINDTSMRNLDINPAVLLHVSSGAEMSKLTEVEFNSQFLCPETYTDEGQRSEAIKDMLEWYASHHKDLTIKKIVDFRLQVLTNHGCHETLSNIANTLSEESEIPAAAVSLNPVEYPAEVATVKTPTKTPSFNCSKARSRAEILICTDTEFSRLDNELAALYEQAKSVTQDKAAFKKTNQDEWRRREKTCTDRDCLLAWYANRRNQLNEIIRVKDAPK